MQGPPHGHPLQLHLGEGDEGQEEVQKQLQPIEKNTRHTNQLKHSEDVLTNLCLVPDTTCFFPASSFYPGHCQDNTDDVITDFALGCEWLSNGNSDEGDTEVESKEDWLTEPMLGEVPTRNLSKALDIRLIEARTFFFLSLFLNLMASFVAANLAQVFCRFCLGRGPFQ